MGGQCQAGMARRRTISVRDYPEYLNPFSDETQPEPEDEIPERFKFHTVGRPKKRSSHVSSWNIFGSRKSKTVEANLNLSPRMTRSASLNNAEFEVPPPPPTRRKLFPDLTWLTKGRRFGHSSRSSSPRIVRPRTPSPENDTTQRYRSISMTRTSENSPDDFKFLTLRTHRYRSSSQPPAIDYRCGEEAQQRHRSSTMSPMVNGGQKHFRPSSVSPPSNGNQYYYRPSSVSPSSSGGHYSESLYVQESQCRPASESPTSGQYNERLHIDEVQLRSTSDELHIDEPVQDYRPSSVSPPLNGTHNLERLYIEEHSPRHRPPSESPCSSGSRPSPSTERQNPFDEPLVSQRPPRPPRNKKRRAPLPPLPQVFQRANTPESRTTVTEEQIIVIEPKMTVTEEQINIPDQQLQICKENPSADEVNASVAERKATDPEEKTSVPVEKIQIVEHETNVSEEIFVPDHETSSVEHNMIYSEDIHSEVEVREEAYIHRSNPDLPSHDSKNTSEQNVDTCLPTPLQQNGDVLNPNNDQVEVSVSKRQKPETKVRTKFGVCDIP